MDVSDGALEQTLIQLADLLSGCRDPWCIFGGTAMLLHGYRQIPVADIDVLVTAADAERIATSHGIANLADGGTDLFRSRALLHPELGDVPVEILSDFEIFAHGTWQKVCIGEPVEAKFGSAAVFIAGLTNVAEIFRLSGRPKDIDRLKLLEEPTS